MEATTTPAMQRVLGALFDGEPVPEDAHASLTDDERVEVARIAATAALTRATVQAPTPPPGAEEASLRRAQELVSRQPALPQTFVAENPVPEQAGRRGSGVAGWLSRWRRRGS